MNERKICFISCVNNQQLYHESLYYINNLELPEGYEIECISVENAESMTEGYNKAMKASDAKYKVYLHQDVYITNQNFIEDMLSIFNCNDKIGMLGVAGSKSIPVNGIWWEANETYGKVYESHTGEMQLLAFNKVVGKYQSVQAIDGLIMVTQQDILWREDIFDGWHFYDISQSVEFQIAGYEVVIPMQEKPWIVHDCGILNMKNGYEDYRKMFLEKYSDYILPLVSILIPTYNRPEYFQLALESALNQTYQNIEIIVGDDSTNDDTEELMTKSYLNTYQNIKYYHNETNLGQFDNDIKLFNMSQGQFINYLMDDDLFESTKIEKMIQYFLEDTKKEIKLVTSYRKLIDENGAILKDQEFNKCLFDDDIIVKGVSLGDFVIKLNYNCIGEPTTVLFRKADLKEMFGTFDGRKYGCNVDVATWLNLLSIGKAVYLIEPLSYFRIHNGQQVQSSKMKLLGSIDYGYQILSGYKKGFLQKEGDLKKAIKYCIKHTLSIIEYLESEEVNQEEYHKLKDLPNELIEFLNGNDINEYHKKLKFLLRRVENFDDVDSLSILKGYLLAGKLDEVDIIYIVFREIIQKEYVVQVIATWLFEENIYDISIELFSFAYTLNKNNPNNLYNYIQVLNKTNRKKEALEFLNQVIGHAELVKDLKEQIMED